MGRFRFAKTGVRELTVEVCDAGRVNAAIKEYQPSDEDLVVEFALRSWAPVFASLKEVLGEELFTRLHSGEGGWRGHQEASVRGTLTDPPMRRWVADVEATLVGFVSARLTSDRQIGDLHAGCRPRLSRWRDRQCADPDSDRLAAPVGGARGVGGDGG